MGVEIELTQEEMDAIDRWVAASVADSAQQTQCAGCSGDQPGLRCMYSLAVLPRVLRQMCALLQAGGSGL